MAGPSADPGTALVLHRPARWQPGADRAHGLERKRRFFALLLAIGYREIEVAFPAASQTDFDFVRELVTADGLPDDLWLQVMTPARSELIERTFAALVGAPRAIVHLYNATAPLFRGVVFDQDRAATLAMAVAGTQRVRALCDAQRRRPGPISIRPRPSASPKPTSPWRSARRFARPGSPRRSAR